MTDDVICYFCCTSFPAEECGTSNWVSRVDTRNTTWLYAGPFLEEILSSGDINTIITYFPQVWMRIFDPESKLQKPDGYYCGGFISGNLPELLSVWMLVTNFNLSFRQAELVNNELPSFLTAHKHTPTMMHHCVALLPNLPSLTCILTRSLNTLQPKSATKYKMWPN